MNPFVSIILPCRNEEKFISKCLDSLVLNDYPKENLEILAIDGMSQDKTREIIKKYQESHLFIKLLENPKKITPVALNIGIKNAKGDIIMRADAHATYEKDYISKCLKYLEDYKADNVGGVLKTLPAKNSLWAKAIAFSLSNFFGAGDSSFRIGAKEPKWVDTVFGGCYRKEVFEKIGLFNEKLERTQDIEFNSRLKKAGGKILLVPDIVAYYYPKGSLWEFFKHNLKDGVWAIYPLKFVKKPLKLRHYIPFFFVLTLIGLTILSFFSVLFIWALLFFIGLYLLASFYFSFMISIRERNFVYFFLLPIVFAARHIGYGLGSIFGLIKLI